ncbi:uncharacterized protein Z519_10215 [Cladophialophora bantiana CBS 173.52]|uniref:Uncharacterized protein n=1 Tax=Cladophialophora bantiana (strain ATCC 10958 / CBS 173.52 / CDC B-1940 / NIH 8579) TaxID=1442370 RepID=A0A0D2EH39_CLAB1|nr:uncharacterized protein Z519_10215 [Cladophialophora bantiana CBS 173.52]KIW89361.1 hypothetical protein Z519_10215 [Cladophialophora bantiana CBS 173.52]
MPFRFSELARRGKSFGGGGGVGGGGGFKAADINAPSPSRPVTAASYDFRPNGPPPAPPGAKVLNRNDSLASASICYDNGTGRLHDSFVQQQGLPPHVRTTEQLAEFIRNRSHSDAYRDEAGGNPFSSAPLSPLPCSRVWSSSHYSTDSSPAGAGAASPFYRQASDAYERLRPATATASVYSGTATATTKGAAHPVVVAGIRHRYVARPAVVRVLPGSTRAHEYQGFWLARGTMRKTEAETKGSTKSWRRKKEGKDKHAQSSSWFDD